MTHKLATHNASTPGGVVALPLLHVPPLNPRVRHALTSLAVRDPHDAAGRLLFLQRCGALVLPHRHDHDHWACTLAGGTLDARTVTGAFWIHDIEIAAALELHNPAHPHIDMTVGELGATWMVQVWDRWPGGRVAQVADALLRHLDRDTVTVPGGPPWPPDLARHAGLTLARALPAPIADLVDAGLLAPYRPDPGRARLTLPAVSVIR